jgi:hypothetical protein
MSEEKNKEEVQKVRVSKLAIAAMIFGLLSVISPYAGGSLIYFILPWAFGISLEQMLSEPSSQHFAMVITLFCMVSIPLLFYIACVVLCFASTSAIKRSKGKLCGSRLAFGGMAVATTHIALCLIYGLSQVE